MSSSPEQGDSIDSLVGKTAVVAERIAPGGLGKAELRGTSWTAKNVSEQPLKAGQTCIVEQVDGFMPARAKMVPGGIIMLFFGAAALIVGLLVALGLGGPIWLQWALFSVVSVVSLLALRGPILRRMSSSPEQGDSIDSLVGKTAVVAERIAPGALGKAELRGTSWTAKNRQ